MDSTTHPSDFERSDADPRLIAALAIGTAIFLAASPLLLRLIYPSATQVAGVERNPPKPEPPVLEVKPKLTLQAQRSREEALLDAYGWVDRDHQIARIPIERSMQLLAGRGLPGWPATNPSSR